MKKLFMLVMPCLIWMQVQAADLPDFTRLVENNAPAVVNISTTQKVSGKNRGVFPFPDIPDGNGLGELFREFFERHYGMQPDEFDARSLGSGVIVSADGYIMTNTHVVEDADEILVRLHDRREMPAKVIGADQQSDLALLKIDARNLPTVRFGSSKKLKVGEWVVAIGNPFGFDHTVTAGIVSAKGRSFRDENYVPFIQTDVAINPGNSGGPLFNIKGEVVGINSRITSGPGQQNYIGLSFAIPVEVAMNVMEQLKQTGRVSRGWLGVLIQDVTAELSRSFGLKRPTGALVAKVLPDGPAEEAGIEVGDIILEFNGQTIGTSSELPPLVGSVPAGKDAEVVVIRNGKRKTIRIKIGELPDQPVAAKSSGRKQDQGSRTGRLGLDVQDMDKESLTDAGVSHGIRVTRVDDGAARDAGIRRGDIIQVVDNRKITSVSQFNKVVRHLKAGTSVAILVYRDSGPIFLAMRVPE